MRPSRCATLPSLLLALVIVVSPLHVATAGSASASASIEEMLDALGWEGQVGQMAQIDVNMLLEDDKSGLRQDLLDHYIGDMGVGSVLNNVAGTDEDGVAVWTVADFRRASVQIQKTAERFGRPPVVWGLDSVHGANYLYGAVVTPQPLNLAATFNGTVPYQAGLWASRDTRRAGIQWLFSPLLGLSWNPFWSRVYETFGEDPLLVGDMASAMIEGIQKVDDDADGRSGTIPSRTAACGKHWVGYSFPHDGHDRAPSWIPTRHLYQYFLLPWRRVLSKRGGSGGSGGDGANLLTVMESYTEVDGVPNVANRRTLSRLLRRELGFEGMLVTDYHEIFNLLEWHRAAANRTDALLHALLEGSVDMSMIATEPDDYWNGMMGLQRLGPVLEKRVRSSARRVLQLKERLNMFEESFQMGPLPNATADGGEQAASAAVDADDLREALEMTQQSIVLAKNEKGILPLAGGTGSAPLKVLVTGPTSDSLSFQTGGWTWQWQGVNSHKEDEWFTYGSTVKDALQGESSWKVSYECGVDILGNDCQTEAPDSSSNVVNNDQTNDSGGQGFVDTVKGWVGWKDQNLVGIGSAMKQARVVDVIVVCLGEENYAEKPGDIRDLNLPTGQYELVAGLREAAPDKTIVLVYFGGRPRLLANVVSQVDAVLLAFLPGPLAGNAVANILAGRANPSGRLPITYPMYQDLGGVPYLHAVSDMCTRDTGGTLPHWENIPCEVQWPFGHGLSYTQFGYSDVQTNVDTLQQHWDRDRKTDLEVYVTVTNKGDRAGSETVLFFSFDDFRSTTPEYKRLRGYEKVWLEPGGSTQVMMAISLDDLRFVGPHDDSHYILQDGMVFRVGVGADADCRTDPDSYLCSRPITIQTESDYVGACEAACGLWQDSGCHELPDEPTCRHACSSIHHDVISTGVELNNDGWGWGYVKCLESLVWNEDFDSSTDCWKMTSFCRNVLTTPGMDEYGSGEASNEGNPTVAIGLSLLSGLFASIMIVYAMQGGCKSKEDDISGDVQFSAVNTSEIS